MENRLDLSCLHGKTVILPGVHDKEGRPIISITIPSETPPLDIVRPLHYLLSIFSKTSRSRGITTILDARKGPWKVARSCIKQVTAVFEADELAQLIVLRPDAFWDKQRVENCTSLPKKENQVIFIPRSRLNKFVDQSQLLHELGGNFIYNHDKWIENRQKVEDFYADVETTLKDLEELHQYLLRSQTLRASQFEDAINTSADMAESAKMLVHNATETGRELIQNIEYEIRTRKFATEDFESISTPQDVLDTIERIDDVLDTIRKKQQTIEQAWSSMERTFVNAKDLSHLEEGVVRVTNWILGHAETLLNSRHKVGYDVSSAEELRREHEAIELQCWNTYGAYAEIIHKINCFSKDNLTEQHKDLLSQKDFMDFVCRSFALRLERRRNILITSLRFFRLVAKYFDKTGEVFDSLVMGNKVIEFQTAGLKLKELQDSQANLDSIERELLKEGEKLSDMLSMPVKDALGREITVDYSEDIVNIRDILDATTARKNIFSDSVELQKLTLEQITHIDCYEKDANQAVQWLDDLLQVMLKYHCHVGCSVYEIQSQKEEHQVFQETAKDTFHYGCQLLNASLVLRQSCKLPLEEHNNLYQKLKNSWQRLLSVSQEQMTRLRVSAVFHRSVEEQCNQLRDLREAVATIPLMDLTKKKSRVAHYFNCREKLLVEVGRMVRLGRLLRTRLKEQFPCSEEESFDSVEDNDIAVEAISERLSEVTGLAEELDQTLQSAQQDCSILSNSRDDLSEDLSTGSFLRRIMDTEPSTSGGDKTQKSEDLKSDEEFNTASECTIQHSRSSSYNTASECEHYAPWWEYDKEDKRDNIAKEKMVLAVGLPQLPLPKTVLKPSPEVPPGKIVHEVIETTHLKVQHSHTMGVKSFVLSSETVKDKNAVGSTSREEIIRVGTDEGNEQVISTDKSLDEEEYKRRIKEVGYCDDGAWKTYHKVTKQAIKGFI